ncbi:MAG: hypothetical protein KDA51_10160 [Planctomycetales bacterium]|nr:hypothetical protein [Planctomycetales bacterium]
MKSKPWQTSRLLEPDSSQPGLPDNLNGFIRFIEEILAVENWRCEYWKKRYPSEVDEITEAITARTKGLRLVKSQLEHFRQAVSGFPDSDQQEAYAFEFMLMGIVVDQSMLVWLANDAERAQSTDVGKPGNTARKVSDEKWKQRQRDANDTLESVRNNPLFANRDPKAEAAKLLGISKSSLENWLRGGRR